MKDGYEVVEEWSFGDSIANKLSVDHKQADEALGPIMYALNRNPLAFDVVYGDSIRVAHLAARPFAGLPPFRVFFRANPELKWVDLLWVDHG